jgi:hypothetical protein
MIDPMTPTPTRPVIHRPKGGGLKEAVSSRLAPSEVQALDSWAAAGFFEPLRRDLKERVTEMANRARGSRRTRSRLLAAYSGREAEITMPKGRKRGKR